MVWGVKVNDQSVDVMSVRGRDQRVENRFPFENPRNYNHCRRLFSLPPSSLVRLSDDKDVCFGVDLQWTHHFNNHTLLWFPSRLTRSAQKHPNGKEEGKWNPSLVLFLTYPCFISKVVWYWLFLTPRSPVQPCGSCEGGKISVKLLWGMVFHSPFHGWVHVFETHQHLLG